MSTRTEILKIMKRGAWLTIPTIQERLAKRGVYTMQTALSARLREFKDPKTGLRSVISRPRNKRGLWEYRMEV